MLKEALKYIVGLSEPHYKAVEGIAYADKPFTRIHKRNYPDTFNISTLRGFMEYVCHSEELGYSNLAILVESPTRVSLQSDLDLENERSFYAKSNAMIPSQQFGDG